MIFTTSFVKPNLAVYRLTANFTMTSVKRKQQDKTIFTTGNVKQKILKIENLCLTLSIHMDILKAQSNERTVSNMCIICISPKGKPQPTKATMKEMFLNNPHGAGYMFLNGDGNVEIHKGFMTFDDFYRSVKSENFTNKDVVVYHFRIQTQGGINPYMTHPFPLTKDLEMTKKLDLACSVGIAHNGIISLTSDGDKEYSDTAKFITKYLVKFITNPADLDDRQNLKAIETLCGSKLAILDTTGNVTLIGQFITEKNGIIYSNKSYKPKDFTNYGVNLFDRSTWSYGRIAK